MGNAGSAAFPRDNLPHNPAPWGEFDDKTNNVPEGFGPILYNATSKRPGGNFELSTVLPTGEKTVVEVFLSATKRYGSQVAAGYRKLIKVHTFPDEATGKMFEKLEFENKYTWISADNYRARVFNFARGFEEFCDNIGQRCASMESKDRQKVVIYAETQLDWMACAMGSLSRGLPIVTIYATLGEDGALFAMNQVKAEVVIADAKLLMTLVAIAPKLPNLKYVITLGDQGPMKAQLDKLTSDGKVKIAAFEDLLVRGAELRGAAEEYMTPKPSDIAVIMFTSGTTGPPKGVIMSHSNFTACLVSAQKAISILDYCDPDDSKDSDGAPTCASPLAKGLNCSDTEFVPKHVYMACLPLAHIMEMASEVVCFYKGIALAYGNPHTLTESGLKLKRPESEGDALLARPTFMVLPPAILEKIYGKAMEKAPGGIKKLIFDMALESGNRSIATGDGLGASNFLNSVVFKNLQGMLGGRVKAIGSGSAPLAPDVHRAMQTILAAPIRIGYGLTETMAVAVVGDWSDFDFGVCGPPTEACCIRLADWPEGNYLNSDVFKKEIGMPRGEVLIGGPLVTQGYYIDPDSPDPELEKKNVEDYITLNGIRFFRSGDIGQINKNGVLQIIDRKKDLWKGPQGEYVALTKVENLIKMMPTVDNAWVYGRTGAASVVCFVVPSPAGIMELAKSCGSAATTVAEACNDPKVNAAFCKACVGHLKGQKLVAFEIPSKCHLCDEPWTPENELLTAQLKLKRPQLAIHYKAKLDEMYAS